MHGFLALAYGRGFTILFCILFLQNLKPPLVQFSDLNIYLDNIAQSLITLS